MSDLYNVSKYTDQELYNILDISNPTDRELEARILFLIRKYEIIQNEDGIKLKEFFESIYDHFFQDEGEIKEVDENTKEEEESKENVNNETVDSQLVTQADYIPDNLRLNPLLKQTIKRIICIDSKFRDIKTYPNTNNFSFDLSEPLRDVVSLKLYSIQIPYTWYTISNNYGSNFFYLKGVRDGINNGYHDYKIEIIPGNYTSPEIVSAVNDGFKKVFTQYPDTSFNNTNISYNSVNSRSTINIDIQKVYTESYYTVEFPNWTPSVTINSTTGNAIPISDASRNTSIASYLGFNYANYYPNTICSDQTIQPTSSIKTDTTLYTFDNSNNYFTVIQYSGPELYNESTSKILNTYKVTINNPNTNTPANSSYTRFIVTDMVNTAIRNANIFTTDSEIYQFDISGVYNANNTCYKLKLMFDRNKVLYQENANMVVIFPDENNQINKTIIWTSQPGNISCFYFSNKINEFSIISSELSVVESDVEVKVGDNVNVNYKCWTPNYMITKFNDFSFNIPAGSYTYNQYVSQLNTLLQNSSDLSNNQITLTPLGSSNTNFSVDINSYFEVKMGISKIYTNKNYLIYFDSSSVLCKEFGFRPTKDLSGAILDLSYTDINNNFYDLSGSIELYKMNDFSGNFTVGGAYNINSTYVCTIYPDQNSPNKKEPPRVINVSSTFYKDYTYLLTDIQKSITSFIIVNNDISNNQTPYKTSTFSWNIMPIANIGQKIDISFAININYSLNQSNYIMYFNPQNVTDQQNAWFYFGIEPSYNLYNYTNNTLPYSDFSGNKQNTGNQIQILNGNNTIQINAVYDPNGGAYTPTNANNLTITVPPGKYTATQLCNIITSKLNENPLTYGSSIYIYTDTNTNIEYTKILINVDIIYTSSDYNLVFYDPFTFIECNSNLQGIQNATWDNTLGWILGYRDYTEYSLTPNNQTTNIIGTNVNNYYLNSKNGSYTYSRTYTNEILTNFKISLTADTTLTTSLYNYFVISLDDYNQNHINDGLVTITRSQTSIQMPYYASTSRQICDPVTNKLVNRSIPQYNSDNLTDNQLYSINQSNISQNPTTTLFSAGPFIKDLFAYVPIKPGTNGTFFIEYGGGLQLQERLYFGPVNIRKMSIQLMTDRGDYLDLNGSDWSFSFICEQLYRSGNSSDNK